MKPRPKGFLADTFEPTPLTEVADYIRELHQYLWKFVDVVNPGASGSLSDYVDESLEKVKELKHRMEGLEK